MSENDIQIADIESYQGDSGSEFSHQQLVMRALMRASETGCREMKAGWFNEKTDRFGNKSMVYVDDTRKIFIESIKTAEMNMACDLDEVAKDNIEKIKKALRLVFLDLCAGEKIDWENANIKIKQARWKQNISYKENGLHPELQYSQDYVDQQVDCYREIYKELILLTHRLDFYKAEDFEA